MGPTQKAVAGGPQLLIDIISVRLLQEIPEIRLCGRLSGDLLPHLSKESVKSPVGWSHPSSGPLGSDGALLYHRPVIQICLRWNTHGLNLLLGKSAIYTFMPDHLKAAGGVFAPVRAEVVAPPNKKLEQSGFGQGSIRFYLL